MACHQPRETYADARQGFTERHGIVYLHGKPFSGNQFMQYDNGDTAFVRHYTNGRKTGRHRGWWPGGQLKSEYHYGNDVYEGSVKEWFENGKPYRSMNYAGGQESGRQQIHLPDGTLYANYEVRNGRNYGMTGTRHCKNYWKDER